MRLLIIILALSFVSCTNENSSTENNSVSLSDINPQGYASHLGTVNFPNSCIDDARELVERGVGLLHNMTYGEAHRVFTNAVEVDINCAMAYWGKGMAVIHPLWPDTPSDAQLEEGWELVKLARQGEVKTDRENDYINALAAYYENATEHSEAERLVAFDTAWEKVYRNNPDDLEAAAFYALMHLAPPLFQPEDKNYTNQKESAAIVATVLEQVPEHPGAHHYTIHAYDFPALAGLALKVSNNYGKIAPDVPHALHMPSHIYTRLGLWKESIEMNIRSGEVALQQSQVIQNLLNEYPHALDYLVYAYLQLGQDKQAEAIRDELFSHDIGYSPINYDASAYALAAVPARILLEQHRWDEAAILPLHQPENFPWAEQHAPYDAIIYFTRAIGAARGGDIENAGKAIAMLEEKRIWIKENRKNAYWDKQIDTQLLASRGWLAFSQGNSAQALTLLSQATELEEATEKAGVTPGEVLPAGELLADLYLELEMYVEALDSYLAVLEYSPNRFNSVYGVARSAELSGKGQVAMEYYQQLVTSTDGNDVEREQLTIAQAFITSAGI